MEETQGTVLSSNGEEGGGESLFGVGGWRRWFE